MGNFIGTICGLAFVAFMFWFFIFNTHEDNGPIVPCNHYENPDCGEEDSPLDASDIYGPGEATLDGSSGGNGGYHYVEPYTRSDGTSVRGHFKSNPDGNPNNNLGGK